MNISRFLIYQVLGSMMLAQVEEYRKVYSARMLTEKQADEMYQADLKRKRTLRNETELILTAPRWIAIALLMGGLIGAIAGHNLMSRGVVCDQAICELLRFDGNEVR